jgi:23S rRNA maturation mini-RNase III
MMNKQQPENRRVRKEYQANYYLKNIDRLKEYKRNWYKENKNANEFK